MQLFFEIKVLFLTLPFDFFYQFYELKFLQWSQIKSLQFPGTPMKFYSENVLKIQWGTLDSCLLWAIFSRQNQCLGHPKFHENSFLILILKTSSTKCKLSSMNKLLNYTSPVYLMIYLFHFLFTIFDDTYVKNDSICIDLLIITLQVLCVTQGK